MPAVKQPRDEKGWRVPRGEKSKRIYDLLQQGKTRKEIHAAVGGTYNSLGVLIWKIKHPD